MNFSLAGEIIFFSGGPMIDIKPIQSRIHLDVLGDGELQAIRSATLDVLDRAGVHFPSGRALQVFADHGARVDHDTGIVRLAPEFVMETMALAPRTYSLSGRSERPELLLDGSNTYFGTADCGHLTVDFVTGEERPSRKEDVAQMARVADYLPSIAFYWPLVSAQEFGRAASLHELDASLNNTTKHIQTQVLMGAMAAKYALRMGEVIAGNANDMRARPPFSIVVCTISPLAQDKDGIEGAMEFVRAGVPVGFMSLPALGSTAPASMAGALVTGSAEVVSAMVLMQLVAPGAPVFYSLSASVMDPRSGGYLIAMPQRYLCNTAAVQIGHAWGVPAMASVFNCEGGVPATWQLGRDSVYNALMVPMAGAEMAVGLGILKASTLLLQEQILLDDEIYHANRIVAQGIDVSSDDLAVEEIASVGPRGHFLLQSRTQRAAREIWVPKLSHPPKNTRHGHRPSLQERAREQLEQILTTHEPQPLDTAVRAELASILESATRDLNDPA
jgi:trimethylamine--corrinoid protein Co-methyltransferase